MSFKRIKAMDGASDGVENVSYQTTKASLVFTGTATATASIWWKSTPHIFE